MIYEDVRNAGVVRSQYEFSRLCGRCVSWFSSSRCQRRQMPAAALANLSVSLEAKALHMRSAQHREQLHGLAKRVRQEMWRRSIHRMTAA